MLGLRPIIDSYRVWRGHAPVVIAGNRWSQETLLMITKVLEAALECFPQLLLQLTCLLSTKNEQRSSIMYFSVVSSLCTVAFALYTGSVDGDRDVHDRKKIPHLVGWSGNAAKMSRCRKIALGLGMMLFFAGYIGCSCLGISALAAGPGALSTALCLGVCVALYHLGKLAEGEHFAIVCHHTLWPNYVTRRLISFVCHTIMFVILVGAPAPFVRHPGQSLMCVCNVSRSFFNLYICFALLFIVVRGTRRACQSACVRRSDHEQFICVWSVVSDHRESLFRPNRNKHYNRTADQRDQHAW